MGKFKWNRLTRASAYARAQPHLVQHTVHGAIVTICGVLLALILFWSELKHYVTPYTVTKMHVDLSRSVDLEISLNLTFTALPCQVLSLDLLDISGDASTVGVSSNSLVRNGQIHKERLDEHGNHLGLGEYIHPTYGWQFVLNRPKPEDDPDLALSHHEGCNIHGWLHVKRVAGNFHIGVHPQQFFQLKKTQQDLAEQLKRHMFDEDPSHMNEIELYQDLTQINVSHVIHELSFGPKHDGHTNALDGFERFVDHDSGTFKYFLKVVPTKYVQADGTAVDTYQTSVTEYYTPVAHTMPHGPGHSNEIQLQLPSVFFLYDMSPIGVTVTQQRRGILHFLVRVCAVVGGVFAVTGMMDKWVHRIVTAATGSGKRKF